MSQDVKLTKLADVPVYGLDQESKSIFLCDELGKLTNHHNANCPEYAKIISKIWPHNSFNTIDAFPFLPVQLFKYQQLKSVPDAQIFKTMTSSGTTMKSLSKIFLDKRTSAMQIMALSRIVSNFIGPKRMPLLVVDCQSTIANRLKFSARTAGILGFSVFGKDIEFALNDDMSFSESRVKKFLEKYSNQPILIFGFTYIIFLHLLIWLESRNLNLNLNQGILIHGGGWKQLESRSISSDNFKDRLNRVTGISQIYNYYGMVEQVGSVFMECKNGHLHTSSWADVIIRSPFDFSPLPMGSVGLIQVLSIIPYSYPGHSLLTEDEGLILGIDNCSCGRKGKYFKVIGRIQNAEIRGCSDTYTK